MHCNLECIKYLNAFSIVLWSIIFKLFLSVGYWRCICKRNCQIKVSTLVTVKDDHSNIMCIAVISDVSQSALKCILILKADGINALQYNYNNNNYVISKFKCDKKKF